MVLRWHEIGRLGAASETGAAHGSVMAGRASVATGLGVTRQTLRNYVAAWRFVESVSPSRPDVADALLTMPATVVAVYARWTRRDPDTAFAHVLESAGTGRSAAAIVDAERQDRAGDGAGGSGGMLESAIARVGDATPAGVGAAVRAALAGSMPAFPSLAALERAENPDALSRGMGAGEVLRWTVRVDDHPGLRGLKGRPFYREDIWRSGAELDVVAVIEAARGNVGDMHRRNAKTLLARAALAATVHPMAMVLVEDAAAVGEFAGMVDSLGSWRVAGGAGGLHYRFAGVAGCVSVLPADGLGAAWAGD